MITYVVSCVFGKAFMTGLVMDDNYDIPIVFESDN